MLTLFAPLTPQNFLSYIQGGEIIGFPASPLCVLRHCPEGQAGTRGQGLQPHDPPRQNLPKVRALFPAQAFAPAAGPGHKDPHSSPRAGLVDVGRQARRHIGSPTLRPAPGLRKKALELVRHKGCYNTSGGRAARKGVCPHPFMHGMVRAFIRAGALSRYRSVTVARVCRHRQVEMSRRPCVPFCGPSACCQVQPHRVVRARPLEGRSARIKACLCATRRVRAAHVQGEV